jgi:hypothetical protein
MSRFSRILKYEFFLLLITIFTLTGCASAHKTYFAKKKQESLCDLSRLGKNKYFYSGYYERKLTRTTKKIKLH